MDNDTSNVLLKNDDTTEKKLNRKAQRAKDSHTKRAAKKAGKPLDYAALGIAEEAIPLLKETVLKIASLGRRTTEQTFTLGLYLSEAAELIPAKMVGRWATGYCEITPRHMRNLIGVYKVLSPYQARCVDHAVAPSILFKLISATPDQIEEVIGSFENGHRLKVREVAALVADKGQEPERPEREPGNLGGVAGLRALALAKTKLGITEVAKRLKWIVATIEEALKPMEAGKHVSKTKLIDQVVLPIRRTRGELLNLAVFVQPYETGSEGNVFPMHFPSESGWSKVSYLLYRLGGREDWPAADELGPWLRDEVVPVLRWAAGLEGGFIPGLSPAKIEITGMASIEPDLDSITELGSDGTDEAPEAPEVVETAAKQASDAADRSEPDKVQDDEEPFEPPAFLRQDSFRRNSPDDLAETPIETVPEAAPAIIDSKPKRKRPPVSKPTANAFLAEMEVVMNRARANLS